VGEGFPQMSDFFPVARALLTDSELPRTLLPRTRVYRGLLGRLLVLGGCIRTPLQRYGRDIATGGLLGLKEAPLRVIKGSHMVLTSSGLASTLDSYESSIYTIDQVHPRGEKGVGG